MNNFFQIKICLMEQEAVNVLQMEEKYLKNFL